MRRGVGDSVFDPETGNVIPPEPVQIYPDPEGEGTGPFRAQSVMIPKAEDVMAGEEKIAIRGYLVVIDFESNEIKPGENEDWIEFDECPADPQLEGRKFTIQSVTFGSQMWERDLVCIDNFSWNRPD